jgi:hypothetical protein
VAGPLRVWAVDYAAGALPPVCAKSGEPTSERYRWTFATASPVVWVGLLFGVIGLALLYAATAKRADGFLPLTPAVWNTRRRPVWVGLALMLVVPTLLFILASIVYSGSPGADHTASNLLMLAALLAFTVGLLVLLLRGAFFGVHGKVKDVVIPGYPQPVRAIDFTRVHPNFFEAVTRMYAERAAAQPAGTA